MLCLLQALVEQSHDGFGFDYTFECIGSVEVMRAALECAHRGWGESGALVWDLLLPGQEGGRLLTSCQMSPFHAVAPCAPCATEA